MAGGFQAFFGDDWDDTLDSLKSAPGALGGVMLSALRQLRPIDLAAFAVVVAGWIWFVLGFLAAADRDPLVALLALLPTALWLAAGIAGALVFEISGLGFRTLGYWEAYVIILVFAVFGVTSLRIALNPRDRRVHRGPARPAGGPVSPAGEPARPGGP